MEIEVLYIIIKGINPWIKEWRIFGESGPYKIK